LTLYKFYKKYLLQYRSLETLTFDYYKKGPKTIKEFIKESHGFDKILKLSFFKTILKT